MFTYSKCGECPHRNIPIYLKFHFNTRHPVDHFLRCEENNEENKDMLCFDSGLVVDWVAEEDMRNRTIKKLTKNGETES